MKLQLSVSVGALCADQRRLTSAATLNRVASSTIGLELASVAVNF